ncbi:MAG: 7-carboxy-7-deazaguanine synthase QueE [Akkermansia sp.]|nr:7-carboxy-7-deazaguanine synthase QueE [Akkermansia sp.]MBQ7024546.1 7-carboxy-7-deazaguanine synthase QueE [Akkermansia sp.]
MNIARLNSDPEIFYSLQGEGARTGSPAVFLRLAGCNLHCCWCDTRYSWLPGCSLPVEEVARRLLAYDCPALVITGGEPLLQAAELEELLALLPRHFYIEVETNGTIAPTPALVQRVNQWNVSPKLAHAGNAPEASLRPDVLAAFVCSGRAWFKFVVRGEEDWPAIRALGLPRPCIILMPCASTRDELTAARPAVAEMCLRHRVRLGDRLHLVLWDNKKGV